MLSSSCSSGSIGYAGSPRRCNLGQPMHQLGLGQLAALGSSGANGGGGSSSANGSKKPRLVFTDVQRRTLQAHFMQTKRPSKEDQLRIAQQLGLDLSTVGNFFMNARRRSQDKWMDEAGQLGYHLGGGGGGMMNAMQLGLLSARHEAHSPMLGYGGGDCGGGGGGGSGGMGGMGGVGSEHGLPVSVQLSQSSNGSSQCSSGLGSPCSTIGTCLGRLGEDGSGRSTGGGGGASDGGAAEQQLYQPMRPTGQATSVVRLGIVTSTSSNCN